MCEVVTFIWFTEYQIYEFKSKELYRKEINLDTRRSRTLIGLIFYDLSGLL